MASKVAAEARENASGAAATAIVKPNLDAHIGNNVVIDVAGAVVVEANDSPEGDASNKVGGHGLVC